MEYKDLWPTTIGYGKFDSLELSQYIFTNYDLSNPPSESRGDNIFNDNTSYINNFKKIVYNAFDKYLKDTIGKSISDWHSYEMTAWITGSNKNYEMLLHNHSGSQLSAVFYVLAEDKNSGGDIVFIDPRANANRGYDDWFNPMFDRFNHTPETGDYMIFPSFAYHRVNPYSSSLRICVPVDLFLYRT